LKPQVLIIDDEPDLPLMMQVKLLRAIQEKMIRPVGGHEEISVDVRVLSASHKDLAASVRSGDFREDLYYRLNVIEIVVPPLRQRQNDIVILVEHIFNNIVARNCGSRPSFSQEAIQALNDYAFPGNVRELENILERAITWADGDVIDVDDLMLPRVEANKIIESRDTTIIDNSANSSETLLLSESDLGSQLEQQERELIKSALEETRWNKTAAAKKLGITFRALRYKLKKLNLE
jgi:two-component system response regulator PilR (NtrC family)